MLLIIINWVWEFSNFICILRKLNRVYQLQSVILNSFIKNHINFATLNTQFSWNIQLRSCYMNMIQNSWIVKESDLSRIELRKLKPVTNDLLLHLYQVISPFPYHIYFILISYMEQFTVTVCCLMQSEMTNIEPINHRCNV